MACEVSTPVASKKSKIAKRLIMFNALNASRPRTELGQPVLYAKIREGKQLENNKESLKRRSMRTVSDPDINASLIQADEPIFKNEPCWEKYVKDINANDDTLNRVENRKSVKELRLNFEISPAKVTQKRTTSAPSKKTISKAPEKNSGQKKKSSGKKSITEPYEIVNLLSTSNDPVNTSGGKSTTVMCTMQGNGAKESPNYVNCPVGIAPATTRLSTTSKMTSELNFVDDHYALPENSPVETSDVSNDILQCPGQPSPVVVEPQCSNSQSAMPQGSERCSHSDYSDYSDDGGWDSDEFDDSSDEEKEREQPEDQKRELTGAQKKVYNVVMEILTTERAYVRRLDLLEEVYYQRLLKEAKENGTIPEKVVNSIFPNLSPMRTFHKTILLPDLEKRVKTWAEIPRIGDIFKYMGHFFKMNTLYVKNFDDATKTLNAWMKKSPKIASLIEEMQKLPESDQLSLQHHMLEPIQRVPRYKLLLQDYLKRLPEDSPDRAEAEESLAIISEAAAHANESMKIMDVFKKLMEIQERIVEGLHGESLITASRRFIKEGELIKIAARSDSRTMRVLILFNDVMLCCSKVPGNKLKVKQVMDVDGMKVRDASRLDLCDKYAFRIKSRQRVLDLACSSEDIKRDWMKAIEKAIGELTEKRASVMKRKSENEMVDRAGSIRVGVEAPSWIRDDDTIMCMLCATRFWFINRRHHCRGCGRIVCESCSKYKANLEYAGNTPKRVCYACYKKLQDVDEPTIVVTKERDLEHDKLKRSSVISSVMSSDLLWKQPGKSWARGYCVLSEFVLYIYKKRQDVLAGLTIPLPGYCVEEYTQHVDQSESNPKHAFSISKANIKEMTYYFQADSGDVLRRWLDVLAYAVKAEIVPEDPPKQETTPTIE